MSDPDIHFFAKILLPLFVQMC